MMLREGEETSSSNPGRPYRPIPDSSNQTDINPLDSRSPRTQT